MIELKAPKVTLTEEHTNQIEKYAQAVANDAQFRDRDTEWTFILVGNDYNDVVRRKITQRGRAKGILIEPAEQDDVKYTVWVDVVPDPRRLPLAHEILPRAFRVRFGRRMRRSSTSG